MEVLYKHAKNFVADQNTGRFGLQGIYFNGESAIMSNGYVLFMIKNYPSLKRLVEPKTGREISGKYPDIAKTIPQRYSTEISFPAQLHDWIKKVKISMDIVKGIDVHNAIYLHFNGNALTLHARNPLIEMSMQSLLPFDTAPEKMPVKAVLNARYLLNVLNAFKDLDSTTLQIKFTRNIVAFESEHAVSLICRLTKDVAEERYGYVTA